MSGLSIAIGMLLILVGVAGYVYGMTTGTASPTALIPAAFGLLLAVLGAVAAVKDSLRKHVMHVAVLIALIGFIVPLVRLVPRLGELTLSAAVASQMITSVLCLIFVVLAVRSFIAARRAA